MSGTVFETTEYPLNPSNIDSIAQKIMDSCEALALDKKTALRFRLSVEESLNIWLAEFGEGTPVTMKISGRARYSCEISVKGAACNPYTVEQDPDLFTVSSRSILTTLRIYPSYSYRHGCNILRFNIKRKALYPLAVLGLVVLSGLLAGFLGRFLLSGPTLSCINSAVLEPVSDAVFRILSCIAGPMVFLSVVWGIYGIGDIFMLGSIGSKMMKYFLITIIAATLLGALFYPLLGPELSVTASQAGQTGKILALLLNVFPSNIFSPFIEGNTLQVIFLAFVIGVSMIFLGQQTDAVVHIVEQINCIIQFVMQFVSKLVPYFVFIIFLKMIWSDHLSAIATVGKFAVIYFCAYLMFLCLLTLFTGLFHHRNPVELLKICFPSYLIALTTASSAATFESNLRICENELGVSKSLSSFGIPFGMVMFKPCTALYYLLLCFYLTRVYAVPVSASWIVIAVILATITAVATPPIPGGSAATYTILFLQLGIPTEALAVALTIDMVFDFFITSGDMLSLLLELFHISKISGMRAKRRGGKAFDAPGDVPE